MRKLTALIGTIAFTPINALAQAYGAGNYGQSAYQAGATTNPDNVTIGGITLPITGAGLTTIGFALLVAIGIGILMWRHQKKSVKA